MQDEREELHQSILNSFCQVCFVSFGKLTPRKLDEGLDVLYCVKCKCKTHRCCYDLQATSTFINPKLREFVCQKCSKKETSSKACFVCHRKDGPMKVIEGNQVVHVFCALTHNSIETISFYPDITFRKSKDYKAKTDKCGICSKANANQNCVMENCNKKFHGYCVWMTLKKKEEEEEEPQCQKYYFQIGDSGLFDLSKQTMPRALVYEQFNRTLSGLEMYGFIHPKRQEIKEQLYQKYLKQEQQEDNQTHLKRGGFAYVLCKDHERSIYCNCLGNGTGDMVQCQCCYQWYHQKCVGYDPQTLSQQYICQFCTSFYDLKKKIIQEVKGTKVENYDLRCDRVKFHLMDFLWLLRVIDHRISGGQAAKMVKQLAKYPLKTSKLEIMIKFMNKKALADLVEEYKERFIQNEEFENYIKPRPVLKLDADKKPVQDEENIKYNRAVKKYLEYLQSTIQRISIRDSLKSVLQELKFKQKVVTDESYETILQLSKSTAGYAEVPLLELKVQAYSFMQVIKDIDSGSEIRFEDLEMAVLKAKSCENVPDYLLKPLIQRYEQVKHLVQLVSKNIHQKKEVQPETENAVKKLKEEKILPPSVYEALLQQRKIVKELYLLYLKQEGKPLGGTLQIKDKIKILASEPPCKPNRQIVDLISSYQNPQQHLYDQIKEVIQKYSKICVIFEIKEHLKKKNIKPALLDQLSVKYQSYNASGNLDEETEIKELMEKWGEIKKLWSQANEQYQKEIDKLDDIEEISSLLIDYQKIAKLIENLSVKLPDKNEEIPDLGSLKDLQRKIEILETLLRLNTESQLKKNPFTIQKLPQGIPSSNPLVKSYHSFKKEYSELMNKYNKYYDRIKEKLEALKDQKRPRKQLIKDNLEKPNLSEFTDFIQSLQNSRLSMDKQIKDVTNTINKSIEIASKVKKFMFSEKHLESIFSDKQIEEIKKQISDLRRKVLLESELCLDTEFKELYQAEICIRMQHMIISTSPDLDKMGKLLKFAEEEGLDHLSTYARLKSTFQIGHQSTKEVNQIKKHEQLLATEAARESKDKNTDFLYPSLIRLRKSLTLRIPKPLQQRNQRMEALLERNSFLKNKISMFLFQQPKKYQIEEIRSIFLEALKNPFEVEGLNKLINQVQKTQKVMKRWKNSRQNDSASDEIFEDYLQLIFTVEQIETAYKNVKQGQSSLKKIELIKQTQCNKEGLEKVQEIMQKIQRGSISKNSTLFMNMKYEYFEFWIAYIEKCKKQQEDSIPYNKIRSLTVQLYSLLQRAVKFHLNTSKFRETVEYFQEILFKVLRHFESFGKNKEDFQNLETLIEGYIDVEELKYQSIDGLNVAEEIKPLQPYRDMNKFCYADLSQALMKTPEAIQETAPIKRQRSEIFGSDSALEDPYKYETKLEKKKGNIKQKLGDSSGQNEQASKKEVKDLGPKKLSNTVTDRERFKIKQILLKNMKKNSEFASYQDLQEQVRLIENQLFGDYHNNIVKYLEMSDLFEKLFTSLTGYPNLSAKIVKKKFEWSFLKLLIENKANFNDMQKILIERNKETNEQQKSAKTGMKQSKEGNDKNPSNSLQSSKMKEKSVFEMIASGKLDQTERKQMKKEIKAIKERERQRERERKKKKHHKSSRRRSRSRSGSKDRDRSPDAKFSSDSEEQNIPNYIEKQYGGDNGGNSYLERIASSGVQNQGLSSFVYGSMDPFGRSTSSAVMPLMFNPDEEQNDQEGGTGGKKQPEYPKGTILSLKKADMEFVLKKKGKVALKEIQMLTTQDHQKILKQLVDPAFSMPLSVRKDKADQQIIQYLSKSHLSSRKKYKFLVGWFESVSSSLLQSSNNDDKDNEAQKEEKQKRQENIRKLRRNNQLLKQFSIQTNNRQKIFGIQNEHIKMHIMSIKQYVRILNPGNMNTFSEPPQFVTSKIAAELLKQDRLIFVIQYSAERMYELKGIYQNFSKIQAVEVREDEEERQGSENQNKMEDETQLKPVREGETFGYKVQVPQLQSSNQHLPPFGDFTNPYVGHHLPYQQPHGSYISPYGGIGQSGYEHHQPNPLEPATSSQTKTIQYEGWGDIQEQQPIQQLSMSKKIDTINLNNLGRFSPILTDEEHQDKDTGNKDKDKQTESKGDEDSSRFGNLQKAGNLANDDDGDFASNILNALGNSDFQPPPPPIPSVGNSMGREERHQPAQGGYQSSQTYQPYQSYGQQRPGMYPPPPPGGYGQQRWTPPPPPGSQPYGVPNRMAYNPMAVGSGQNRNQMMPPPTPNMMYSKNNPMMGHQPFYPPPPPPSGSQGHYGHQQGNQGHYGQGGYQRQ